MKLIRKSIFALASALMLTACSSDEPFVGDDPNGGSQEGEGVYMGLTIQMPGTSGSRSETVTPGQSTDGNEVGKDYENNVDNVIIVLAQKGTNAFIVAGEVSNSKLSPIASENAYKTIAKIEKTQLNTYYGRTNFDREVNVFVFCNPTNEIRNLLTSAPMDDIKWLQDITNVSSDMTTIANTANKGSFVMANFAIAQRTLPASINDWDLYKTENTAFNLSGMNNAGTDKQVDNSQTTANPNGGAVKVERLASRFDFMDGSPLAATNPDKAYTYNVVMQDGKTPLIQVRIGKMQLVNISKSLYSLRRVSNDGMPTGAVICGAETPKNYVVGPNAEVFANATASADGSGFNGFKFSTYFNNPFFNDNGKMDNNGFLAGATLTESFNGEDDNYDKGSYKIWRYAVENVIPATASRQQNGLSTGVVFKAKMIPTEALKAVNPKLYNALKGLKEDGNALTGTPDENPILYSLNGNLYLTWREVQKSAIEASVEMENNMPAPLKDKDGNVVKEGDAIVVKNVNRTNSLYLATFGQGAIGAFTWGETKYIDKGTQDDKSANYSWEAWNANKTTIAAMRAAVTGAGFTIYQTSDDKDLGGIGYYCYYYYWNRHNDNGKPGIMGDMEFAVVRNNVYKLAVTNIKQLGHPRNPDNDPDKPKPDTPDESSDIYITVTCQVLPWVVRVNNIEF